MNWTTRRQLNSGGKINRLFLTSKPSKKQLMQKVVYKLGTNRNLNEIGKQDKKI